MEHITALPEETRLEEYEIRQVLGQGGFGITYLAEDTHLGKRVAVKEYLPRDFATRGVGSTVTPISSAEAADYRWGLDRFLDEGRALARFEHRHLNKVQRYFQANGTAYLVLEYIEGETLSAVLQREGQLSQAQVERLLGEVLSGLAEVHAAGYVHRDLTPGNLMLRREDGSAVVLDFGAARQAVSQRSKRMTSMGTPGYQPIEQYAAKAEKIGPWSDLYAVGMVAYQCVSGLGGTDLPDAVSRRLAQDDGAASLKAAVEVGQGRYDRQLLAAIDWAIEVQEKDRPQSIGEWRQALPALDLQRPAAPVRSSPPSVPAPERPLADAERSAPSLPRWATVAGIAALLVAVGAGAYWLGQRTSPWCRPRRLPRRQRSRLPARVHPLQSKRIYPGSAAGVSVRGGDCAGGGGGGGAGGPRGISAGAGVASGGVSSPKCGRKGTSHSGSGRPPGTRRAAPDGVSAGGPPTRGEVSGLRDLPRASRGAGGVVSDGVTFIEAGRDAAEGPVHRVTIGQAFAVGVYQVTFGEWARVRAAEGVRATAHDAGWGRGRRPVINVSWDDAQPYVAWLSSQTGQRYRLLSEAEWEYVARAGTTTKYWWGNEIGGNRANCDGCGSQWDNEAGPHRWGAFNRTGSGCTMYMGTCGNGYRTVGTTIMRERKRWAGVGGWRPSVVAVSCAAAPGTADVEPPLGQPLQGPHRQSVRQQRIPHCPVAPLVPGSLPLYFGGPGGGAPGQIFWMG